MNRLTFISVFIYIRDISKPTLLIFRVFLNQSVNFLWVRALASIQSRNLFIRIVAYHAASSADIIRLYYKTVLAFDQVRS